MGRAMRTTSSVITMVKGLRLLAPIRVMHRNAVLVV